MTSRAETRADAQTEAHADASAETRAAATDTRASSPADTHADAAEHHADVTGPHSEAATGPRADAATGARATASRAGGASSAGARRRRPRALEVLALLLLPAALAAASFSLRDASGPYWLSTNLDPTYPYLFNSLNVANLRAPAHTDHPGTPVQLAGAAVIRLHNPSADEPTTARAVLSAPELYARRINDALILVCALCVLAAGWLVCASGGGGAAGGGGLAAGLLVQASPFLFLVGLVGLVGLRPESFLLALSVLLGAASLVVALGGGAGRVASAVALGVIVGLGVATKLTFAPLVLLPLAVLPGRRSRAVLLAAALAAFLFAVSPVLAAGRVPDAFRLVAGVATRTDYHAHGATGALGFKQYAWSVFNLGASNLLFSCVVAAGLLLLASDFRRLLAGDLRHRALLAACVAQIAQLLVVATYPNGLYLVPAAGLLGCNLALVYLILRARFGGRRVLRASLLLVAALVAFAQFAGLRAMREGARARVGMVEELRRRLGTEFGAARVVEYWGASSPTWALKFGLEWNGGRYATLVEETHPGRVFYNPWTRQFSTFDRAVEAARLAEETGGSFVMYGFSFENAELRRRLPARFLPAGLTLENTSGRAPRVETIYKARLARQGGDAAAGPPPAAHAREHDGR
jgi:hypothetical protein